ncbi:urea ABC transporter ATP-binding protein UrtD [Pseudomonas sp. G11-1]|uniref:Urea ABC transporter ATP-binding protein UrtD n=2 Tax=Halopseudomonas bauzanensis TaxID=653930 RepID=A0A1H9P6P2_9GAMM|nr:urea ABC transporter ATP-binding protein UrtD [Pseudomonas sp. G11-1]MCO5788384.1 urea ABC transporter ATP-binding protein UrtD [Pseudomonas sp. G11-2]TKA93411.1 urea ABC transporter ATP-binding protein UrtD [Halopseudomonas bauzanensis]SER43757.1 urea transport system ATP-binding protein [Halopseudomonas bauzanensis]SFL75751.1 urea transport system ATP-binding protein [Halopseudomonas bauzanensis]
MTPLDRLRETWRRDQIFDFMLPKPEFGKAVDTSHGPILYVEDVSVSFDGFKALNNLNLYIDDGELRCIIGPNGAGKTTMMDVITGKTRPDTGSVYFGQRIDLLKLPEHEIARGGIGRKFQKPTIFEALSVFENLELATASDKHVWYTLNHDLSAEQRDRLDEVLTLIGLTPQAHQDAGALSHGQKQWLEIGMLLVQNPRVLLVDEPVAGMTGEEVEHTARLLTSLAGRHSVIVVEHDMAFVRSIARKVTVLHQGSVLAEGSMDQVQNDPRVIEVYLGE